MVGHILHALTLLYTHGSAIFMVSCYVPEPECGTEGFETTCEQSGTSPHWVKRDCVVEYLLDGNASGSPSVSGSSLHLAGLEEGSHNIKLRACIDPNPNPNSNASQLYIPNANQIPNANTTLASSTKTFESSWPSASPTPE